MQRVVLGCAMCIADNKEVKVKERKIKKGDGLLKSIYSPTFDNPRHVVTVNGFPDLNLYKRIFPC